MGSTNRSKLKAFSVAVIAATSMTACSGGSGSGGGSVEPVKPTPVAHGEITEAQFLQALESISPGSVMRQTVTHDSSYAFEFSIGEDTVSSEMDMDLRYTALVSNISADATSFTFEACDGKGPKTVLVEDRESASDAIDRLATSGSSGASCGVIETRYFKVDEGSYSIVRTCDGSPMLSMEFTLLAEMPGFNQGQLNFTSSYFDDVSSGVSVCGELDNYTRVGTTTTNGVAENEESRTSTFRIASPYGDDYIFLKIEVGTDTVDTDKTYMVTATDVELSEDSAHLTFSSAAFGGTAADPAEVESVSGTVTFSAINEYSYAGSVDITTETGDLIQASFAIDIN